LGLQGWGSVFIVFHSLLRVFVLVSKVSPHHPLSPPYLRLPAVPVPPPPHLSVLFSDLSYYGYFKSRLHFHLRHKFAKETVEVLDEVRSTYFDGLLPLQQLLKESTFTLFQSLTAFTDEFCLKLHHQNSSSNSKKDYTTYKISISDGVYQCAYFSNVRATFILLNGSSKEGGWSLFSCTDNLLDFAMDGDDLTVEDIAPPSVWNGLLQKICPREVEKEKGEGKGGEEKEQTRDLTMEKKEKMRHGKFIGKSEEETKLLDGIDHLLAVFPSFYLPSEDWSDGLFRPYHEKYGMHWRL